MTSVAYRVEPPSPGWMWAAGGLVVGWIVAGIATAVLYVIADFVGAIARTYPSYPGALNDWPYPDNGLWSLLTNVAVVLLVLVLTTTATSWWMRRSYDRFSEGRLALVLLVIGWLPLETGGPVGGFFGFLVALLLIRYWGRATRTACQSARRSSLSRHSPAWSRSMACCTRSGRLTCNRQLREMAWRRL